MAPEITALEQQITRYYLRKRLLLAAALVLVLVAMWISCFSGITDLTLGRVLGHLGLGADTTGLSAREWAVFSDLRAPRVVMGALAGLALALCGVAMQVITANRMASPFTTGISSAAAFGAATVIVVGGQVAGSTDLAMVLAAFVAASLCSLLVFGIARAKALGSTAIVLTGIAMNYLFSALNAAMQYVAGEQQLSSIVHWTFGNLGQATWVQILVMGALLGVVIPYLLWNTRAFTLLSMGEEGAAAMGVRVRRLRATTGLLVTILASAVVSFTGVIGFVGLVAPHLATLLVGHDHRVQLPLAGLLGAGLLVIADLLGRTLFSPVVVPVGIVVSFVGVPVFVLLILRSRGERAA